MSIKIPILAIQSIKIKPKQVKPFCSVMNAAAALVPPPLGLPAAAGGDDGGRAAMLEAGAGGFIDAGQIGAPDRRSKGHNDDHDDNTLFTIPPTAAGSLAGTATGVGSAAAAGHAAVVAPPLHYQGMTLAAAAAKGDLPHVALLWGMAVARAINPMLPDAHVSPPVYPCQRQSNARSTDRPTDPPFESIIHPSSGPPIHPPGQHPLSPRGPGRKA